MRSSHGNMAYSVSPEAIGVGFLLRLAILGLMVMLLPATNAAAQAGTWQILLGGNDEYTPHEPSGVAVDSQGTVYVVATADSWIERLSPTGRVVSIIGHIGTGDDALRRPRGIVLDADGRLLVADTANHRIQRFDPATGAPLGTWGVIGSGPGEFILPTSLAIDSTGNVYVADTGNHRVQKIGPDGQFVLQWAGLRFPHGIAVDPQDAVYVTDSDGVRKYSNNGELLADWTAPGEFGDPYGIGIGPDGTVYVADTDNGRIIALSSSGDLLATYGREGKALGELHYPEAVTIDAGGTLYVADRGNDRVLTLRP
jgi:DNA-binding beta-propeller fold protein YncE